MTRRKPPQMTKPDSTDAGEIVALHPRKKTPLDTTPIKLEWSQWSHEQSAYVDHALAIPLGVLEAAGFIRADQQEAALATLTRENAELKSRNEALVSDLDFLANHMTTDWTNRTDVGGKAMLRMKAALDLADELATPPAPLPGGQGPVEALRREIVEALRWQFGDHLGRIAYGPVLCGSMLKVADRLEQGGEGREG